MKAYKIHKVSRTEKGIKIKFETGNGEQASIAYYEDPRPEFDEALQGCVQPALELLELSRADYAAGMMCTSVTFSEDDETWGASVAMKKTLALVDKTWSIVTPHLPAEGAGDVLPKSLVQAVERVSAEAKLYVAGERAQLSMFPPPELPGESQVAPQDVPTGAGELV